jgi:DNA uptake protein ComE-like DNA-binding protein
VFRQDDTADARSLIYGVVDEESRLDINRASPEELGRLRGITPEEVASIIDYRDGNNSVTQGGAEMEQYMAHSPPSMPRNGPFLTLKEPLMVLGLSQELFTGEDANLNGLLDPEENDGDTTYPKDNRDGVLDSGWSGLITVSAQSRNVSAAGESRVNIQQAEERELAAVPGLNTEIARAIVQHRNQNEFKSLADLLEVRAPSNNNRPPGQPQSTGSPASPSSRGGAIQIAIPGPASAPPPQSGSPEGAPSQSNANGPQLINESLLREIADQLTVISELDQPGAVNINTAGSKVLECLPGMTPELAHAIVAHRRSSGFFPNIAGLLDVPGMNRQIFRQLAPRITARSDTFRILSEGKVDATGATRRLQAVVRIGTFYVDTLAMREEDL